MFVLWFYQSTFLVSENFFKVAADHRHFVWKRKKSLKTPEQIISVVYVHVILFRMHERDTATEK